MKKQIVTPLFLLILACGSSNEDLFSGTIEIEDVRISARVSGAVEERLVTQGDQIQTGQTLIKIDQTEYLLALTQTQSALTIAEANLQTMIEGTREQQIISASSNVAAARAARNQAVTDQQRARELAAAGAISDQQLQAAETAATQAQTQYTSAQQNYSLAVEGVRATELEAAQAAVESATAATELAWKRLAWTDITSPVTGTVTGTNIRAGENIMPGMTLLTVADMDTVKAVFYISQPYLAATGTGGTVTVSTNTTQTQDTQLENTVTGTITNIADRAEFTPSQVETREGRTSLVYRVEATIPNPRNIFKAGMPVDVQMNRQ
ncbi:MAG: HlyD family efflux transporter periplasmic adaptor subunit [Candidatus Sabulitectum sp.]|nr:HlyD family efflux transporter periplasmic adaptor subunit [Candidatus Sabulitectum sp.]